MSKRGNRPGPGDVMGLSKQLKRVQKELARQTVEVTAGGGTVTVVATGDQRIRSITIQPEAINPDDPQKLQALLVTAINDALERSRKMAAEHLQKLTGGLNIPGLGL